MPWLIDAKISLVPKHQLVIPSTLLALATNIRTYKATKIHMLTPLTYDLFFKIAQITEHVKKSLRTISIKFLQVSEQHFIKQRMGDNRYWTQSLQLWRLRFTTTGIIEHGMSFQSSLKTNPKTHLHTMKFVTIFISSFHGFFPKFLGRQTKVLLCQSKLY